jgi:hypothetical protein
MSAGIGEPDRARLFSTEEAAFIHVIMHRKVLILVKFCMSN